MIWYGSKYNKKCKIKFYQNVWKMILTYITLGVLDKTDPVDIRLKFYDNLSNGCMKQMLKLLICYYKVVSLL